MDQSLEEEDPAQQVVNLGKSPYPAPAQHQYSKTLPYYQCQFRYMVHHRIQHAITICSQIFHCLTV
eukprot:scaffold47492_cov71-Attheya_sp.AAC.3